VTLRLLAAVLACTTLVAAGCGTTNKADTTALTQKTVVPVPTATTPSVTDATTTLSSTPAPAVTTATEPQPTQESGEGDEESTRVPAAFTISRGGTAISPQLVTVPAFFPVQLIVKASDGDFELTFATSNGPVSTSFNGGGDKRMMVGPLEPGNYRLRTSTGAIATVRAVRGGDVGP